MPEPAKRAHWLVAEFVVVVLGVAVGLAADEWRTTRAARAEGASYATLLIDELEGNAGRASAQLQWTQTSERMAKRLAQWVAQEPASPMDDSTFVAAVSLAREVRVTFVQGTYQDLIATGGTRLLNDTVRASVVGVYDTMRRWEEGSLMAPRGLVDLLQGIIPADARDALRSSGRDCALGGEGCELGDLVAQTDVALLRDTLSSPAGFSHLQRHRWWLARERVNLSGLHSGIEARMELLSQFRGGAS